MSVGELIELLKQHNPELPVWIEGHCCINQVRSVDTGEFGPRDNCPLGLLIEMDLIPKHS